MQQKLIQYISKDCPLCGEKNVSIYENICGKCGNWLRLNLNINSYQDDWEIYIRGLSQNKLNMNDILKYLFPPRIFNYIVLKSLIMLINQTEKRLDFALNEIDKIPDISPNSDSKNKLQNSFKTVKEFIIIQRQSLEKSKNDLDKFEVINPFIALYRKYEILWQQWKILKDKNDPIPEDLKANLKTTLEQINEFNENLKNGYKELKEYLRRLLEQDSSINNALSPSLSRMKDEYQTTMSIIKSIKETSPEKLSKDTGDFEPKIYQINVLLTQDL